MNQYYLGLLLKYEANEKYRFRELDLDCGFDFVMFPTINRKFDEVLWNELVKIQPLHG